MELTLALIKPDAVERKLIGTIISIIEQEGFKIDAMCMIHLTLDNAKRFYHEHASAPFFEKLCEYMSSGPLVALGLQKENAVAAFRELIGATNPAQAAEGTIRKLFATSVGENAIHGSDSDENALIEGSFMFSGLEQC
ncbi:MAG TPA: nucleoside-diphosphate kinase [Chitinophagaceae bacterium]|nr:nucleoside-diphosphate kinase [Chitinophagaceae bacterium]